MSVVHRITGVLMFLAAPFMIYLLDRSLCSEVEYRQIADWLHSTHGRDAVVRPAVVDHECFEQTSVDDVMALMVV